MIQPERSTTNTLTNFTIGLVISTMVGAILVFLMPWLFFELNPVISQLIAAFRLPYQDLVLKVGWYGSAFVIGVLLAMMLNYPTQRIRASIKRRQNPWST
jgi:putative flippase GtrA